MNPSVFVDAEAVVIDHLAARLSGVQVCGEVPNPRPARFVRVERVGGARETRVSDAARFVIEAWAGTDTDAAQLLNTTRSHLFDVEGDLFGADEYGGPARLPDPLSHMCRYSASFTIRTRAVP